MSKNIEKTFTLGGSIEKALSGNYDLKAGAVLSEAWKFTVKNFISFSPAIIILLLVQLVIFYVALKLQLGDPAIMLEMFQTPESLSEEVLQNLVGALFIANFSYEVISAPVYAGVSLMAMSHAAGLKTRPSHILKGLAFTVPVILATLVSLILQGIAGQLLTLLSVYFSIAFSNAVLLICEKRIPPMQSLLLSFRAVNKKLLPLAAIYFCLASLIFLSALFYGFLLVVTLPLLFHAKGIIYRNMFGIQLKIVSSEKPPESDDEPDEGDDEQPPQDSGHEKGSDTFNA